MQNVLRDLQIIRRLKFGGLTSSSMASSNHADPPKSNFQKKLERFQRARELREEWNAWVRDVEFQAIKKNLMIGNSVGRKAKGADQKAVDLARGEDFQDMRQRLLKHEQTQMLSHDFDIIEVDRHLCGSRGRDGPSEVSKVVYVGEKTRPELTACVERTLSKAASSKWRALRCDTCHEYIIDCACKLVASASSPEWQVAPCESCERA